MQKYCITKKEIKRFSDYLKTAGIYHSGSGKKRGTPPETAAVT